MAKLSHLVFGLLLTSITTFSPAAPEPNNLPIPAGFLIEKPTSFSGLVTERAKKAGVSFSVRPAEEGVKVRKSRYLPVETSLWDTKKSEVAQSIAAHLERLENNLGPILVHGIELTKINETMEAGDKSPPKEFTVVVLSWSLAKTN